RSGLLLGCLEFSLFLFRSLGFIRFDNIFGEDSGKIPYGSQIVSASVVLTTNTAADSQSGGAFLLSVLRLPLQIPASGSTFASYSNNAGFGGPDFGDGHTQRPLGAFRSTDLPLQRLDQAESASVDVTEAVQAWALGSDLEPLNNGFVITPANGTDAWSIASSSNALAAARPKLVVTYLPQAEASLLGARTQRFRQGEFNPDTQATYEGVISAWLRDNVTTPANVTTNGNTLTTPQYLDGPAAASADDQLLIQFNGLFGPDPGQIAVKPTLEIQRAVLRLTTNTASSVNAVSPGPADVHQMLVPWFTMDESNTPTFPAFSDFKALTDPVETVGDGPTIDDGEIGPILDSRYGLYHFTSNGFDVTQAVRAWAAGEPNHGLNVQMSSSDGWQIYFPGATLQEARPELYITYTYAVDVDEDGLPDPWETLNGTVIGTKDQDADPDGDTLTNIQEFKLGTRAQLADTDADGLRDDRETNTRTWVDATHTGTNPTVADTDGDGLPDGIENPTLPFTGAAQPGTNPNLADTDNDGFPDSSELVFASDPSNAASLPSLSWQNVLSENFDGNTLNSNYTLTNTAGFYAPELFDTGGAGFFNGLRLTQNDGNGVNSNNSVAWDTTAARGNAVRLTFDYQMSADAATEAGDGFGIGLFNVTRYEEAGGLNPGASPREWEDPRTGGGFPDALMIGFDIYNGAAEGNNVRISGPGAPGSALVNIKAPFVLNNGLYHRVSLTAYTLGSGTALRMDVLEDVAGTAVPHVLFTNLIVPGLDIATQDFRIIAGSRTGSAVVQTMLDNITFATASASPSFPGFRVTDFQYGGTPATVSLSWESVGGGRYEVQESPDLGTWSTLPNTVTATGNAAQWTGTPSATARFWRVKRTQ
ncbi:MAG: peptidase papain, partial [Verrucomicrobiales bacterium]|nr:peptidase papain [Verrucomicrobiales bacterium]